MIIWCVQFIICISLCMYLCQALALPWLSEPILLPLYLCQYHWYLDFWQPIPVDHPKEASWSAAEPAGQQKQSKQYYTPTFINYTLSKAQITSDYLQVTTVIFVTNRYVFWIKPLFTLHSCTRGKLQTGFLTKPIHMIYSVFWNLLQREIMKVHRW